ncbi:MAG: ribosome-associated translation inhibitor RaiA [Patescibacteria group bacterium]
MKINFKGTNLELNDQLRSYVLLKLEALDKILALERIKDEGLATVELGRVNQHHKHGDVFRAEINLHWSGRYFRAEAESGDLYAAVDEVKDELLREIKSQRQRQGTIVRRGARLVKKWLSGR